MRERGGVGGVGDVMLMRIDAAGQQRREDRNGGLQEALLSEAGSQPLLGAVRCIAARMPGLLCACAHISRRPRWRMSRLSAAKASASLGSQVSSTPARKFMP